MNETTQNDPYRNTPQSNLSSGAAGEAAYQYAGFWLRVLASIIDSIVILAITLPLLYLVYGMATFTSTDFIQGAWDVIISYVLPLVFTIGLWMKFGGTPGKRLLGLKVVNEDTGEHLSLGKSVLRYIGYFVSMLALFIGFLWVAFDKKKKGFHDHIAGSVVVKDSVT